VKGLFARITAVVANHEGLAGRILRAAPNSALGFLTIFASDLTQHLYQLSPALTAVSQPLQEMEGELSSSSRRLFAARSRVPCDTYLVASSSRFHSPLMHW